MLRAILATVIWIGLAVPSLSFDIDDMSPQERQHFGQEVRDYLLANPEILMDIIAILEDRQGATNTVNDQNLIAANSSAIFDDGYSFVGGNPDGDVTIVEFLDYRCGFCKRAHPEVTALIKNDGNIRYIVKEYPILGPQSDLAARFAISVLHEYGAEDYAIIHDALMTFRGNFSEAALKAFAKANGLDYARIQSEMNAASVDRQIAGNKRLAELLQITGTPGFVMDSVMVRGFVEGAQMQEIVAALRQQ